MKEESTAKNISDKNKEDLTQELESNTPPKPLSKNSDLEKRIHSLEQSLEQRVGLETLFSQRFSELRGELRREVDSRFRKYGMVALQSMFYTAQILTQKGKYDEAEKTLKKVEEINNNFRWLYVGCAYLFIKQGKQDDSEPALSLYKDEVS
ncbi:MAG TPA: hypothetical protein VNN20_11105 [Thermodesulfobacteriota bacterium]|nr:hypothetical protein [Thermodesulfobacteriota bacterium]